MRKSMAGEYFLHKKRAKMNYFKVYKDSYQRKELYQQLHIFER